jgi:hypothetical protein
LSKENKDFKIPPISTLIGSTLPNFFRVLSMSKIDRSKLFRLFLTFLVILISTPFQLYEYFYFRKKIKKFRFEKAPIFIIGHWRSGTTHLHNLLCKDRNHGYVTTYQGVFPNNMKSKWIFRTFMKMNIPEKRPSDNVKLSPNFPQEEEFALGNMTDMTFYHFFYFPSLNDFLYEKFVRLNGISEKQLERLKNKYRELLIKAALNTKKKRIVVKNPLNTGKIKLLLDMFPDAKFIHIYRNPVVTYLSTNKFYKSLLPATYLQDYKEDDITDKIIGNYRKLMKDYFETKHLIPEKNLYEIKFEEFEQDNMQCMKEIYERFDLDSWEEARPMFQQYMLSQKQYKKNKYKISQEELEKLKKEWGFAMQKLNYEVPSNLQIE